MDVFKYLVNRIPGWQKWLEGLPDKMATNVAQIKRLAGLEMPDESDEDESPTK